MFSLIQRSFHNISLSPAERSLLKAFWGLVHTALIVGFIAGMQAVIYGQVRDLKTIVFIGGGVFVKTIVDAVSKYINASAGPIWQPGTIGGISLPAVSSVAANTPHLSTMPPPQTANTSPVLPQVIPPLESHTTPVESIATQVIPLPTAEQLAASLSLWAKS